MKNENRELGKKLDSETNSRKVADEQEQQQRQEQVQAYAEKLKFSQTGGLNLSLAGFILLCFGIATQGCPTELARLFGLTW